MNKQETQTEFESVTFMHEKLQEHQEYHIDEKSIGDYCLIKTNRRIYTSGCGDE